MFATTIAMLLAATCPTAPDAAADLTVMSYNLRYGHADDGPDSWEHRREAVVALVRDHDPDIIGTQECLDFQAAYLADELPAYQWLGLGRQADGSGEMTAILYKPAVLVPLESGHLWLSETPAIPGSKSWDSSLPRIASWVKFYHRPTGRPFFFYNTHFDHKGQQARLESARLLENRVRTFHPEAPVVVTGDFNAQAESSEPWKALTAGPLADTWTVAAETDGQPNTWNGFKQPDPTQARRIDWILVSAGLPVRSCTIDARHNAGRFPSDHMPVIARLTVPRGG